MTRFFFDLGGGHSPRYDFTGCMLASVEQARARAELMALDLCCRGSESPASSVDVRDVQGDKLFSVCLPEIERVAA